MDLKAKIGFKFLRIYQPFYFFNNLSETWHHWMLAYDGGEWLLNTTARTCVYTGV